MGLKQFWSKSWYLLSVPLSTKPRGRPPLLQDHGGYESNEIHESGRASDEPRRPREKNRGVRGAQTQGGEKRAAALTAIATAEVKKTEKFVIPQVCMLKLKHEPARKAGKKMMFGKEVKVAAKPASKVVKAFPAKALKDSIRVALGRTPWG